MNLLRAAAPLPPGFFKLSEPPWPCLDHTMLQRNTSCEQVSPLGILVVLTRQNAPTHFQLYSASLCPQAQTWQTLPFHAVSCVVMVSFRVPMWVMWRNVLLHPVTS